jgi:biopolymer transport protein ExbD
MRVRPLHPHQPAGKINVTPLIDVVMVLIIFYLIVGKLAAQRQGHVELPASGIGTQADAHDPVIVTVLASEAPGAHHIILVDGHEVPDDGLESVLRSRVSANPSSSVVQVRADRRLPYSDVAPVIKACRDVGLTTLRLVTERTQPIGGAGGTP